MVAEGIRVHKGEQWKTLGYASVRRSWVRVPERGCEGVELQGGGGASGGEAGTGAGGLWVGGMLGMWALVDRQRGAIYGVGRHNRI